MQEEEKGLENKNIVKALKKSEEKKLEKESKNKALFSVDTKLDIIYEDDKVFVINKPAGLMVHGDGRSDVITLSDILAHQYPELLNVGEDFIFTEDGADKTSTVFKRPGIVHRLDEGTTGCLIICKTRESFRKIKNGFQEHKVKKIYRAIVEGVIRQDTGIIDTPIARAKSDFRKRNIVDVYSQDFRGAEREAITRYKVLARNKEANLTLVECYPVTGRTHQIRVHLRGIRHPIIGDELYGTRAGKELLDRPALHSYSISFKEINVTAQVPEDMQTLIDKYFKMC